MKRNEGLLDRALRALFAEVFILIGYFWVSGVWSIVFYVLAFVMLVTSVIGFCGVYPLMKINTLKYNLNTFGKIGFLILAVVLAIGGAWGSIFVTKKMFLEDFSQMNNVYKKLLFDSGKEKRAESIEDYEKLSPVLEDFVEKYTAYKPWSIRKDAQFDTDMHTVEAIVIGIEDQIHDGNLVEVHKILEGVRATFQDILKRNNFSMLTVILVDFHDIMEEMIDAADDKDTQRIIETYPSANEKLTEAETYLQSDDMKTLRSKFETLTQSAKDTKLDVLATQAQDLKSSFIKVYLGN